jgi:hypothetical protein
MCVFRQLISSTSPAVLCAAILALTGCSGSKDPSSAQGNEKKEDKGGGKGAQPKAYKFIETRDLPAGTIGIWKRGDKTVPIKFDGTFAIAKSPFDKNKLAVGVVHSGYTGRDPDGKSVLLNVTLQSSGSWKTAKVDEKAEGGEGPEVLYIDPSTVAIDIRLPDDPAEEKRLKRELKLPRKLAGGDIPISIKWIGVGGKTIHRWLTDADKGLQFVFTTDGKPGLEAVWRETHQAKIDVNKLDEFWKATAGDEVSLTWEGGTGPFVHAMLDLGVVVVDGKPIPAAVADAETQALVKALEGASEDAGDGLRKITRNALFTIAPMFPKRAIYLTAVVAQSKGFSLAKVLQEPQYVKDLTEGQAGIDALLKDEKQ